MVSNTKEFVFKRKKDSKLESLRIVPDDPSNIFEFSYVKKTKVSKDPIKIINFDEFLFTDFRKLDKALKPTVKNQGNTDKKIKESIEKSLNIKNNPKEVKEDKIILVGKSKKNCKDIVDSKPKLNELYKLLPEKHSLNDLLMKILDELSRKNNSEYLKKIKEVVRNKEIQEEEDIQELEMKSKNLDREIMKWMDAKEKILCSDIVENLNKSLVISRNEENISPLVEAIDFKILDKVNKINFLKNSIKCSTNSLGTKVHELEIKLYNITNREEDLDPMVLLKAITKSK